MKKTKTEEEKQEIKERNERIKKWLLSPKVSPLQIFIIEAGTLYFIFFETDIFKSFPDFIKVIFYIGIMVTSALFGVSIINMKKWAEKVEEIYYNSKLTPSQKEKLYMEMALQVLDKISDIFYNQPHQGVIDMRGDEEKSQSSSTNNDNTTNEVIT